MEEIALEPLPTKKGEDSGKQKDKAKSNPFLDFLVENIGPTSYGARNWFNVIVLTIFLLGLFPAGSFAAIMVGKGIVIGAIVAVIVDVWIGLREGYTEFDKAQKTNISFFDYLYISIRDWFQHPRNQVQFFFGASLLILAMSIFLLCGLPGVDVITTIEMPELQDVILAINSFVHSFSTAYLAVFNELLSETVAPYVTSIFLSIAALTAFDVFCRVTKWIWPIKEEKAVLSRAETKAELEKERPNVEKGATKETGFVPILKDSTDVPAASPEPPQNLQTSADQSSASP